MFRVLFSTLFFLASALCETCPVEELALSRPEETFSDSELVCGLINPLSGLPSVQILDLKANAAVPLALSREYRAPFIPIAIEKNPSEKQKRDLYYNLRDQGIGWRFLSHLRLHFNPSHRTVRCAHPAGPVLEYFVTEEKTKLTNSPFAIHNTSHGVPSGRYDVRNTRIRLQDKQIIGLSSFLCSLHRPVK